MNKKVGRQDSSESERYNFSLSVRFKWSECRKVFEEELEAVNERVLCCSLLPTRFDKTSRTLNSSKPCPSWEVAPAKSRRSQERSTSSGYSLQSPLRLSLLASAVLPRQRKARRRAFAWNYNFRKYWIQELFKQAASKL